MIHPGRGKNQIQTAVAGEVGDSHIICANRGELGPLSRQSVGSPPVYVRHQLGGDTVFTVYYDQVVISVTVNIDNMALPSAVIGQFAAGPVLAGVPCIWLRFVDPSRPTLNIAVAVGNNEINIAVIIYVCAVNGFDHTFGIDVQVTAAVFEASAGKVL